MSVEVKNLTKIYGTQRAVDDISFTVKSGEIVGFLGPNGAGKSTTMKIATCYVPPTSGLVKVSGFDVEENPVEVRKHVGYLPEHNPLYLDMYVPEYLEFIGSLHNLSGSALNNRIKEMIGLVGLERERTKKIGALSKGYRQRVGLAQALIHNPDVLILDEPTTGLDPNQIQEIRNVIRNVGREKTVIFSTHIMQEVAAICDRVVIINRGKLVADSQVADLEANTKGQRVTIAEFENPADERLLKNLPQVKEVKKLEGNSYRIVSDQKDDPRSAISRLALEQNWGLIGLRQEENSLEKIFQQLTK
ncbi:gliding motility-associated ABC transporter ATP-binding subunit GldA [Adhaeribacter soli]|uniref:Gliding motility-associated ABC transporter ATP-binding subunit GldA n=1 Tax=Adhaeribacter soli TaxID=2607655 RepID=A0A5N1J4Z7_9BACT|nr:gliding motility-associated ABC transporter ATP-binding subunit GldA [Adhaeribacter soli]KAA9345770.1 gliding motility-associated ABC transporter ATP-binding subunit GldA [Adhaeribacter soli]